MTLSTIAWLGFFRDLGNPRVPLFERWTFSKIDNLKMSAIKRPSVIVNQTRMEKKGLRKNFKHLGSLLDHYDPGVVGRDISTFKSQLNMIIEDRYRRAMVWVRADKFLFSEQPTNRALASEQMYAISKEINSIQTGPILISDKAIIVITFVIHYKIRFSSLGTQSAPVKIRRLLFHIPTLSEADRAGIETPIELTEI